MSGGGCRRRPASPDAASFGSTSRAGLVFLKALGQFHAGYRAATTEPRRETLAYVRVLRPAAPPATYHLAMQIIDPPPHFCGLDPDLPITCHRRHLPHWRQEGATYFVTYRLSDSIPRAKSEQLRDEREHWLEQNPPPPHDSGKLIEHAKLFSVKVEKWLDAGSGSCVLAERDNGALVATALQHFDSDRYHLFAYVVMPNHFHAILQPLVDHDLDEIWESWKRFTAHELTKCGVQLSPVWFREGYDRIFRDAEHLYRVVRYIGRNPQKAGLHEDACPHGIHADWTAAGRSLFDNE